MDNVYIKADDLNKWILRHLQEGKDLYSINEILGAMEDMDDEIENLKDKLRDIERDIEDNYKPISKAEQSNVREGWFH